MQFKHGGTTQDTVEVFPAQGSPVPCRGVLKGPAIFLVGGSSLEQTQSAFAMAKPTPKTEAPKSVVCSPARDSRRSYCCDYCSAHPQFHVSWEFLAKPHP